MSRKLCLFGLILLLTNPLYGGDEQFSRCVVAVGEPVRDRESVNTGVTDEVVTFAVFVSEDTLVVPRLAVIENALRVASGKEPLINPVHGGDPLLPFKEPLQVAKVLPVHLWDAETHVVRTLEAQLDAEDKSGNILLYKLPERFPGRVATLYDGAVPDGVRVACYPRLSFSLNKGWPEERGVGEGMLRNTFRAAPVDRTIKALPSSGWGVILGMKWPMRGATVYADGKLVGIVAEYTKFNIEPSPSFPELRGAAVYVILADQIRPFLKERGVL